MHVQYNMYTLQVENNIYLEVQIGDNSNIPLRFTSSRPWTDGTLISALMVEMFNVENYNVITHAGLQPSFREGKHDYAFVKESITKRVLVIVSTPV